MPLQVNKLLTNSLIVDGYDICDIQTPVFDIFPYIIQPVFTKTCTEVKDTAGFGLDLEGWKISGSVLLPGSSGYSIYLGTITWKNANEFLGFGILPWKVTGSVQLQDNSVNPVITTNPLGCINFLYDDSYNRIIVDTNFVNFFTPDGDDLLIDVVLFIEQSSLDPNPPVSNLNAIISFELESLFPKDQDILFEFNPPII